MHRAADPPGPPPNHHMPNRYTRRSFLATLTAATAASAATRAQTRRPEFTFTQYHNQTADSSLHKRLTEMWAAVGSETKGRVEAEVFALNNNIQGSDPAALKLLVAGD